MSHSFETINPATGQKIKEYKYWKDARIQEELGLASDVFNVWKKVPIQQRLAFLKSLGQLILSKKNQLAGLISMEMGKPIKDAKTELEKCVTLCGYYVKCAEEALKEKPLKSAFSESFIQYAPKGLILGIMPWNFPFWQVFRFAVPAILAGNTVWLKHAPNTTECNLIMERLFLEAGFPKGVFQAIVVDVSQVEQIIAHPIVGGVSLTGSEKAGSAVAALAGKYIKPSILELGGNDAFLIGSDVDLRVAMKAAISSRMINTGQTCISTKRIFVPKDLLEEAAGLAKEFLMEYRLGKLDDPETKRGYMARADLAESIEQQYERLKAYGADVRLDLLRSGNDVSPALILMKEGDRFMIDEELFGPVALLYPYSSIESALEEINASPFGLGAAVWTEDIDLANRLAESIDVGCVAINDFVRSDIHLPFGGTKKSGYGRELHTDALYAFTNQKTVYRS